MTTVIDDLEELTNLAYKTTKDETALANIKAMHDRLFAEFRNTIKSENLRKLNFYSMFDTFK